MSDRPDLAALIGSRICHDLISPIGAIGNGVELLMMDGTAAGPEMALIAESVAHANARIRFFRIAFGAASADQRIGRAEVQGVLSDLMKGSRLGVDWHSPADLSRGEVKLAFLMIQCLETAMPYGGRIRVERGAARWTVSGGTPRLKIDPDLWDVLSNPRASHAVTAAQVHFALIPEELARQGRKLTVETDAEGVRLSF